MTGGGLPVDLEETMARRKVKKSPEKSRCCYLMVADEETEREVRQMSDVSSDCKVAVEYRSRNEIQVIVQYGRNTVSAQERYRRKTVVRSGYIERSRRRDEAEWTSCTKANVTRCGTRA